MQGAAAAAAAAACSRFRCEWLQMVSASTGCPGCHDHHGRGMQTEGMLASLLRTIGDAPQTALDELTMIITSERKQPCGAVSACVYAAPVLSQT